MRARHERRRPSSTKQIAQLFGTPVRIYRRDFTDSSVFHGVQMVMNETDVAALDRNVQHNMSGLCIEFKRPSYNGRLGIFAVLPLLGKILQTSPNFTLIARFRRPIQRVLGQAEAGTYAAVVAMSVGGSIEGELIGTTLIFNTDGSQRLNALGMGLARREPISSNLAGAVMHSQNPATITLTFFVKSEASEAGDSELAFGYSKLYIGEIVNGEVDSVGFDFKPNYFKNNAIADFRVGLGTVDGHGYTVSLNILSFEIWVSDASQSGHLDLPD